MSLGRRAEEIRGQVAVLQDCQLDEDAVAQTLEAFEPIWEVLHTAEKERILRLVLEKVTYDGKNEELTLAWRLAGLATLSGEVDTGW